MFTKKILLSSLFSFASIFPVLNVCATDISFVDYDAPRETKVTSADLDSDENICNAVSSFTRAQKKYLKQNASPKQLKATRKSFFGLKSNPDLPQNLRSQARFILAEMQYLGLGGSQKLQRSRKAFTDLSNDTALDPKYKSIAAAMSAGMQYLGLGGKKDLVSSLDAFKTLQHDPYLLDAYKSAVAFILSEVPTAKKIKTKTKKSKK